RRAVGLAAPAFRARVEIERVLPREVLERAGAEVLVRLTLRVHHRLDVEGPKRSLGPFVLEEDVGNRRDDVQVLAVAEASEDQGQVRPEEDAVDDDERLAPRAERPENTGER